MSVGNFGYFSLPVNRPIGQSKMLKFWLTSHSALDATRDQALFFFAEKRTPGRWLHRMIQTSLHNSPYLTNERNILSLLAVKRVTAYEKEARKFLSSCFDLLLLYWGLFRLSWRREKRQRAWNFGKGRDRRYASFPLPRVARVLSHSQYLLGVKKAFLVSLSVQPQKIHSSSFCRTF